MSFTEDQAQALNALRDALKGTTFEDFIKSAVGQAVSAAKPPPPDVKDEAPGPVPPTEPDVLKDLAKHEKPAPASVNTFLALHARNYIQRDINTAHSFFVPTMLMFYYVLNVMDTVLSDNYYARRALPFFYPTITRIYFAILIHYHLLRVMRYNNNLDSAAASFLDFLEDQFPPETLAIPAPLLPFFQALTTSTPENKRLRRVFPTEPLGYLENISLSDRFARRASTNNMDWHLPFIPFLAYFHHQMMEPFTGIFTLGADDSQSAGRKTVNPTPVPGYDYIVDVIHHPRSAIRHTYFPMKVESRTNNGTPNATTDVNEAIQSLFTGSTYLNVFSNFDDNVKEKFNKCGLAEEISVHKDLTAQFKANFSRITIPEVNTDWTYTTWPEAFLMHESSSWFSEVASTMAGYSLFFPNSGTLADASLEGPKAGQYIAQIATPATLTPYPRFFADPLSSHVFNAFLTTTVSEEEPVTELLARYTQVNTRMYPTHPWLGNLGSGIRREGVFWDVRPVYDHGTTSTAWIQVPQMIKSAVVERPLGKKVE